MQVLINTLPLLFLFLIAFYSFKMPFQKAYTFENSSKLWLIHVILITGAPIFLLLVYSIEGIRQHYAIHLSQFLVWRSNYGLPAGIIYITPWSLHDSLFLIPPLIAFLSYFFSPIIIRRYENLIPATGGKHDHLISSYKESISFFENEMRRVINTVGLPSKPSLYVKKYVLPNCYVFGKGSSNFSIVVTTGLLDSIAKGSMSADQVDSIISHEIGHVLNSDLRLASSVKMFSDLKIIRFIIFGVFSALLLIYLSGIGLNLYYNPSLTIAQKLSRSYEILKHFLTFVLPFLTLYIAYAGVELLIRTTFKTREFFADVQALRIFKDEAIFVKTLEEVSSPFHFLIADSRSLAAPAYTVFIILPQAVTRFFSKTFFFLPKTFHARVVSSIEVLVEKLRPVFLTHPTLNNRLEAIANRTYFPKPPLHISFKAYLTVGITLLISLLFIFLTALNLNIFHYWWSYVLYFGYALVVLVVINNAHLRYLHKYDLQALEDSFFLAGFGIKHPIAKSWGRKLFFATHVSHLPFTILPLTLLFFAFPLKIFVVMLVIQFILTHLLTSFVLKIFSWSKKAS